MKQNLKEGQESLRCLLCGKPLTRCHPSSCPPEQGCWNDAGVHEFVPGYGSQYDMTRFVIGLCDDCIAASIDNGRL